MKFYVVFLFLLRKRIGGVLFDHWRREWHRRGMADGGRQLQRASEIIGVAAPWQAPKFIWKFAWRLQQRSLPWLHRNDEAAPGNTCVNLQILWLKALGGDEIAYAMLPQKTKRIVAKPLRSFYPRLHHQNVLMRSRFLDNALQPHLEKKESQIKVCSFGAGFCTRAFHYPHIEWIEIDLPTVIHQKKALIKDRHDFLPNAAPKLKHLSANLSDISSIDHVIDSALERTHKSTCVVFLFEALLIYLPLDAAIHLLKAAARYAHSRQIDAILVFADRIPNVSHVDQEAAVQSVLLSTGWSPLLSYLPKPGLARHMGVARLAL